MTEDLYQRLADALRETGTVVGRSGHRIPEQLVAELELDIDVDRVKERLQEMRLKLDGTLIGRSSEFWTCPEDTDDVGGLSRYKWIINHRFYCEIVEVKN